MKINHILYPTDFSESSNVAIDYVKNIALQHGSRITMMYVIDQIGRSQGWYVPHISLDAFYKELEENAQKKLDHCCYEQFSEFKDIERVIAKGKPDEEIVKYADNKGVDLIVMASPSKTGMDFVFGSAVEKVIRKAKCPVLCVRTPLKA